MRRTVFFFTIIASLGVSLFLVLGYSGFWMVTTGNSYADAVGGGGERGADMFWDFFLDIFSSAAWGTSAAHFRVYGLVLFVVLAALCVLSLVIIALVNGFALNRSRRLYRNATWFLAGTIIMTAFYIWHAISFMNTIPGSSWSMATLPIAFYVPLIWAIACNVLALILSRLDRRSHDRTP